MSRREIIECDLCTSTLGVDNYSMQTIFHTSQNDGVSVDPYFSIEEIDLCESCYKRILKDGKYIHASGCQCFNEYWI